MQMRDGRVAIPDLSVFLIDAAAGWVRCLTQFARPSPVGCLAPGIALVLQGCLRL